MSLRRPGSQRAVPQKRDRRSWSRQQKQDHKRESCQTRHNLSGIEAPPEEHNPSSENMDDLPLITNPSFQGPCDQENAGHITVDARKAEKVTLCKPYHGGWIILETRIYFSEAAASAYFFFSSSITSFALSMRIFFSRTMILTTSSTSSGGHPTLLTIFFAWRDMWPFCIPTVASALRAARF